MSTDSSDHIDSASPAKEDAHPTVKKTTKKAAKKATKKVAKKKEAPTETDSNIQLPLFSETKAPVDAPAEIVEKKSAATKAVNKTSAKKTAKKATSKKAQSDPEQQNEETNPKTSEEKIKGKKPGRGNKGRSDKKPKEIELTGDPITVSGLVELAPKGYGFLRIPEKGYSQARDDVFVPPEKVRTHALRHCVWIDGMARQGSRGLQLTEVLKINGEPVGEAKQHPFFDDLKAVNPDKRISFETADECFNTRILDLVSPVGRGQRGLIVAPPRSGKTTLLMDIAKSLQERHEETIHPIFLLIDERPEEVTEFKRSLPEIEMFSSSNDSGNRNHMRIAELCIERAKRLVEEGKHVFILMDSITRLARAYNRGADEGGKGKGKGNKGYQSGGLVSGALEIPRRLFAAARNTREAGSLTILATALVQTNSKADEAIFQEFKGTGNMEIVLDRRLADHYIYPAVDIFKSGTRREELLLPEITMKKFHLIRRGLKGHRTDQAMERLLYFLKKFPNNAQMLMEIKG